MHFEAKEITQKVSKVSSLKAILIGVCLIPLNNAWMTQMEMVWGGTYPSVITLLFNVVFSLFVLIWANHLLGRWLPKLALSQSDLLVIYIMLAVGCSLNGTDVMQTLVYVVGAGFWYATPENEWSELFHKFLPNWLTISDKNALQGFFEGRSTLYDWEIIRVWLKPIVLWCGFTLALVWVMLCINVLIRKQWIERERLTYPVVRLPFEMAESINGISSAVGGTKLFRNRGIWIGFAIAAGINLLNGLAFLYPQFPMIPVKRHPLAQYFTEKPWNAISGWATVSFYPFAIGLGYLIPLDLSFSCWFFYLFWQFERIVGAIFGWRSLPGFPYPVDQLAGTWIGLFLFSLWASRRHLRAVAVKVWNLDSKAVDDRDEPMRYRSAVLGLLGGLGFITIFCVKAGMSFAMTLAYFGIYLALSLTITRIRAELGPPIHDMYGAGPDFILTNLVGTKRVGRNNLATMTLFYWLNREAYRSHTMPHQLEGFKLAQQGQLPLRGLMFAMLLALVVSMFSAFWVALHPAYQDGAGVRFGGPAKWFALEGYRRLASYLQYSTETNAISLGFMGFGFLLTVVILLLRMNYIWCPLHPVGYAVSTWWAINQIWFPIFISFVLKSIILRYGGLKVYRRSVPFFLGLILGEFIVGGVWSLLGIALGRQMYAFWV